MSVKTLLSETAESRKEDDCSNKTKKKTTGVLHHPVHMTTFQRKKEKKLLQTLFLFPTPSFRWHNTGFERWRAAIGWDQRGVGHISWLSHATSWWRRISCFSVSWNNAALYFTVSVFCKAVFAHSHMKKHDWSELTVGNGDRGIAIRLSIRIFSGKLEFPLQSSREIVRAAYRRKSQADTSEDLQTLHRKDSAGSHPGPRCNHKS